MAHTTTSSSDDSTPLDTSSDTNSSIDSDFSFCLEDDLLWENLVGKHNDYYISSVEKGQMMLEEYDPNCRVAQQPPMIDIHPSDFFETFTAGALIDADDDNDGDNAFALKQEPTLVASASRRLRKNKRSRTQQDEDKDYLGHDDEDEDYVPSPPSRKKCRRQAVCKSSRSNQRSSSTRTTPSTLKKKHVIVGPDSVQMKTILRMVIYLEENTTDEEDPAILQTLQQVIQDCRMRHLKRQLQCLHLPGAIFDKAVRRIGGPAFKRVYKKSKVFEHPRLHQLNNSVVESDKKVDNGDEPSTDSPNLLQVAFLYGIHLAKSQLNDVEACSTTTTTDKEDILRDGADLVMHMKESERQALWKRIVNGESS